MRYATQLVLIAAFAAVPALPLAAADWITAPSFYTHDWSSGQRVAQYSPVGPFYYYCRPDYVKSGYRHLRSTLDLGNSSDNMHIVEEWGRPVRPYDEWRFPFRPFSVPYDQWGPPFGGLGGSGAFFPYGFPGGFPGGAFPGGGSPGPYPYDGGGGGMYPYEGGGGHGAASPPVNFAQPWLDGHYPAYDHRDRSPYWKPYVAPVPRHHGHHGHKP